MRKNENTNKFSIAKFLFTTLCTTILTIFIGFTILFIDVVPTWINSDIMKTIDTTDEGIEAAKYWEELFENYTAKEQEEYNKNTMYGDKYSAKGNLLIELVYGLPSYSIVKTFTMSFLVGVVLGIVVYIIIVQNAKGKKMIIELISAFLILWIILTILNWGYQIIINKIISNITTESITYYTHIYDLESNDEYMIIQYIAIIATIYIINLFRQKIIANKLNKELNK